LAALYIFDTVTNKQKLQIIRYTFSRDERRNAVLEPPG
jgi:hypothetical protein